MGVAEAGPVSIKRFLKAFGSASPAESFSAISFCGASQDRGKAKINNRAAREVRGIDRYEGIIAFLAEHAVNN